MLFTRCPDCDTTFRVTDEALKKANGQVRCGRCASVFNAYAELQQPRPGPHAAPSAPPPALSPEATTAEQAPLTPASAEQTNPEQAAPAPTPAETPAPTSPEIAQPTEPSEPAAAAPAAPEQPTPETTETAPEPEEPPSLGTVTITPLIPLEPRAVPAAVAAPPPAAAESDVVNIDTPSVADVVAEVEVGTVDLDADPDAVTGEMATPPAAEDTMSPAAVEQVLGAENATQDPAEPLPLGFGAAEARPRSRWWSVAAVVALLALGVQVVHHYRAELARDARMGPWLQRAYTQLGIEVTPRWDVRQYEILDWIATAEPNTRGLGSLKITARIQNRGPTRQPFPSVQLRLKDRWEDAVGKRMFTPVEYLPRTAALGRMMAPGETARAELEIVDPGPDAYGFELDVCIELERNELSCGNDKVFL